MNKLVSVFIIVISCIITGCADTPNNVNLTVQQGQCVTGSFSGYEATPSLSPAFPMNINMPAQSPYCAAITLTNNNNGKNANNIQVSGSGLQVSYTLPAVKPSQTTVNLIDFNASGIESTNFGNPPTTFQKAYNLALFDPNNCVTTLGPKVKTYGTGGQSCTFYMQLLSESLPVGVYPFTLSVSYTNGNSFYTIKTTLKQRVNLYLGGNMNPAVQLTNAQGSTNAASTANSPESNQILSLTRDIFGNVYSGDNIGVIYKYTGTSKSSWLPLLTGVNSQIVALTSDTSGNVYAALYSGNVFEITPAGKIIPLGMPAPNLSSMAIQGNNLYVTAGASFYSCTLPISTACNWATLNSAPATINSLLGGSSGIFAAAGESVIQFVAGNWVLYGATGLPGGNVTSVIFPGLNLFAGVTQIENSVSAVWYSTNNANFMPTSSASGAILGGSTSNTVFQIASDAGGGLFVAGIGLNSSDFGTTSNAILAYVYPTAPAPVFGISTKWIPISVPAASAVSVIQTATQLTPY